MATETLGEAISRLAKTRDAYDLAAVAAAQERHQSEGSVEIDDNALTSRANDETGTYVLAWVWVDRDDMQLGESPDDEDEEEEEAE